MIKKKLLKEIGSFFFVVLRLRKYIKRSDKNVSEEEICFVIKNLNVENQFLFRKFREFR